MKILKEVWPIGVILGIVVLAILISVQGDQIVILKEQNTELREAIGRLANNQGIFANAEAVNKQFNQVWKGIEILFVNQETIIENQRAIGVRLKRLEGTYRPLPKPVPSRPQPEIPHKGEQK